MYRYQIGLDASDGLAGEEGTCSMCTFWLVEALTRSGRLNKARLTFEKMLSACMQRRSGPAAKRLAISRRPSPIWA